MKFNFYYFAIVGFFAGYFIISKIIDVYRKRNAQSDDSNDSKQKSSLGVDSLEDKYRAILGVSETTSKYGLKEAYRVQIAKYHPDKVNHLGKEFILLAHQRTNELNEAYDFFKNKYGI